MRRYRKRDWKDPFSWFWWAQEGRPQVLFKYQPNGESFGAASPTFTRADASTCATYVDKNGVVQTVAANVLRDNHYVNGVRTTLLEGSRTNAVQQSSDYTTGSWTKTTMSTAKNATGPDGVVNSACTVTATSTAASARSFNGGGAVTAGQKVALSFYAKAGTAAYCCLQDGGDAVTHRAWIKMADGSVGTQTNCTATSTLIGNGWYRFVIVYTATNNYTVDITFFLADTDNSATCTNGVTHLAFGVQSEVNAAFPSSYIPTGAAAVTRAADALSFPFGPVPQTMTALYDGYDLAGSGNASSFLFDLSDATDHDARMYCDANVNYRFRRTNASASVVTGAPGVATVYGDRMEMRPVLNGDGSVLAGISVNSGAETVSATSATLALDARWGTTGGQILTLNAQPGTSTGFNAVRKIVFCAGVQSMNTMRTL